jgi:hypothetical protein
MNIKVYMDKTAIFGEAIELKYSEILHRYITRGCYWVKI